MDYERIYEEIIEQRKGHPINSGYKENHHRIPRSLKGADTSENMVYLTAREHFICHLLLAKMYPKYSNAWYKMNHALMMMKCESFTQNRYFNGRLYEHFRKNFSKVMSKVQTGNGNSQYGTMWICNIEFRENKKILKETNIPHGWIKGRNKWVSTYPKTKICAFCKEKFNIYGPNNRIFCTSKCRHDFNFKNSKYMKALPSMLDDFRNGYTLQKCFERNDVAFSGPLWKKFKMASEALYG